MNDSKKIAQSLFFKFPANIILSILAVAMSVILNRYFGKEKYALLIMVFTVTSFAFIFSGFGVTNTINRFVPRFIENRDIKGVANLIVASFMFKFSGMLLFASGLYLFADVIAISFFKNADLTLLLRIGILYFIGFTLVDFILQIFQGLQKWKRESLLSVVYPLLYLVLVIFFVYVLHYDLSFVLYANFIAAAITIVIGIALMPKNIIKTIIRKDNFSGLQKQIMNIVVFGLPFIIANVNFYVITWFDKVIIGRYCLAEDLTFYYIAFTCMSYMLVVVKTMYSIFMPYMAGYSLRNKEEIAEKFQIIFKFFLHIGALIAIIGFFYIGPFIHLLYGPEYQPIIYIFRIMLVIFMVRTIMHPYHIVIINIQGRSKLNALLGSILALSIIIFGVLLIPRFGIIGALWAGIISYLINVSIISIGIKSVRELIPFNTLIKATIVFCGMLPLYYIFRAVRFDNFLILSTGFLFLYIALMYFLKEITQKDFVFVKNAIIGALPR